MRHPDYYLVIDIEATCDDNDRFPRREREVIEMGAVIVEALTLDIIDEYQSFVKPVRHPRLTQFCMELTGIRQIEVEIAPRFPQMMEEMTRWLRGYPNFLFCSWGKFDQVQIERDCVYHRVPYPLGKSYWNLKSAFSKRRGLRREMGILNAMRQVGFNFQGHHHRGLDDARNAARLLPFIV